MDLCNDITTLRLYNKIALLSIWHPTHYVFFKSYCFHFFLVFTLFVIPQSYALLLEDIKRSLHIYSLYIIIVFCNCNSCNFPSNLMHIGVLLQNFAIGKNMSKGVSYYPHTPNFTISNMLSFLNIIIFITIYFCVKKVQESIQSLF